ncbi:MAG TPA: HAD-IA family hydrolase [Jiangellaceae bacterium]
MATPVTTTEPTCAGAVFDLDGTLVDTLGLLPQLYAAAIREVGGPEVSAEEIVGTWHIGSSPVLLGHFLDDPSLVPAALECFYEQLESGMSHVALFPGIAHLLAEARALGVRVGVLTNATRRNAEQVMRRSGLDVLVDVTLTADEVPSKPRPDGLLALLDHLGVAAESSIMVGDSWNDLAAADAAGVRGVHAAWTDHGQCRLPEPRAHDCVVAPSIVADYFWQRPHCPSES